MTAAVVPHRGYLSRSLDEVRIARLPITVVESTYEARAYRGDRLIGWAVRTGFDTWHVPAPPQPRYRRDLLGLKHLLGPPQVAWASYGTRAQAVDVLRRMAAGSVS